MGTGLGFYRPGSVKNLEEDLLVHERTAAEANTQASWIHGPLGSIITFHHLAFIIYLILYHLIFIVLEFRQQLCVKRGLGARRVKHRIWLSDIQWLCSHDLFLTGQATFDCFLAVFG